MKKILLLNPPFLPNYSRDSRSPAVTKSGTIYYPIWLSYAAGYLLKNGINVKLIDAVTDPIPWKLFTKMLTDENYDIIAVHTSTPSIESDGEIAQDIKKIVPNAMVYLTGTHPSALPEETLKMFPELDGVIKGELEIPLLDLAQGKEPGEVRGLIYRENNKIYSGKESDFVRNLDDLEWVSKVYRTFLDPSKYFYSALRYPVITINAGRGCKYHCSFCVLPQVMTGHQVRLRSIEDIIEELKYIKKEMPWVKEIMFEDDTFTSNHEWLQEFCMQLIRKNIKLRWSANARADLDSRTLTLMKYAGLRLLFVGFESPNSETLKTIKKGISPEDQETFMIRTRAAGILVHGSFIFGLPGEDKKEILEAIEYAIKLAPDSCQFFPLIPYPGTNIYSQLDKNDLISFKKFSEYLTPEGYHSTVVNYPDLSKEMILKLCYYARIAFYKRTHYYLRKILQILKNPGEAPRIFRAYMNFRKHIK